MKGHHANLCITINLVVDEKATIRNNIGNTELTKIDPEERLSISYSTSKEFKCMLHFPGNVQNVALQLRK